MSTTLDGSEWGICSIRWATASPTSPCIPTNHPTTSTSRSAPAACGRSGTRASTGRAGRARPPSVRRRRFRGGATRACASSRRPATSSGSPVTTAGHSPGRRARPRHGASICGQEARLLDPVGGHRAVGEHRTRSAGTRLLRHRGRDGGSRVLSRADASSPNAATACLRQLLADAQAPPRSCRARASVRRGSAAGTCRTGAATGPAAGRGPSGSPISPIARRQARRRFGSARERAGAAFDGRVMSIRAHDKDPPRHAVPTTPRRSSPPFGNSRRRPASMRPRLPGGQLPTKSHDRGRPRTPRQLHA